METRPVLPVPACEFCGSTEWTAIEETRETEYGYKLVNGEWTLTEEGTPDVFTDYYCGGCEKQPDDDDVLAALGNLPIAEPNGEEE